MVLIFCLPKKYIDRRFLAFDEKINNLFALALELTRWKIVAELALRHALEKFLG